MKIRIIKVIPNDVLEFHCPACDEIHTLNTSWNFNGDINNPTISPSILVRGHYNYPVRQDFVCHSFIRDGKIQYCADCTHAFKGQTVELPEL